MVDNLRLILASMKVRQWLCDAKQWDTQRTNCVETTQGVNLNVIPDFNTLTIIFKGKDTTPTFIIAS
jgi:hypothetical protein